MAQVKTSDMKWYKAVIRTEDTWFLIEARAHTIEEFRLNIRKVIKGTVKVTNIEEV